MTWLQSFLSIHHLPQWACITTPMLAPSASWKMVLCNQPVATSLQLRSRDRRNHCCRKSSTWRPWIWAANRGKELASLLDELGDIFSSGPADFWRTCIVSHCIDIGDHPPIKQAPRGVPMHQLAMAHQHVDGMLQCSVVQPSSSSWAAPIVMVKINNCTTRFCINYRKLNNVTRKDTYSLPPVHETLDALAGS